MRTLARILVALTAALSLQVAVPVSADTSEPAPTVEIGCALLIERAPDGTITETCR